MFRKSIYCLYLGSFIEELFRREKISSYKRVHVKFYSNNSLPISDPHLQDSFVNNYNIIFLTRETIK